MGMDEDGSGCITYDEWRNSLDRKDVRDYMSALDIDMSEADVLFSLLDRDGDGHIDLVEFVEGMHRLKGEAKSSDIQLLIMQGRQMMCLCQDLRDILNLEKKGTASQAFGGMSA